ncbi:MAG: hypothetical protein ACP6IP_05850 [Candidatus Njordarchaeia archaeon]
MSLLTNFLIQIKYDMYTIFLYAWLLYPIVKIKNLGNKHKNNNIERDKIDEEINQKLPLKKKIMYYMMSYLIGSLIIAYRYIILPRPQGFDIPEYIYWAEQIDIVPNTSGFIKTYIGRIISIIILKIFYLITRNYITAIILVTIFFAGIFTGGVYLLISEVEGEETGVVAAVFTSFTFAFYRLYLDLIANQIAWSLMPYALFAYIRSKRTDRITMWQIITIVIIIIMLLAHVWSTAILVLVILFDSIIDLMKKREKVKTYSIYYLIIILGAIIISIVNITLLEYTIMLIINSFYIGANKLMFVDRENIIIIILALVGIYKFAKTQQGNRDENSIFFLYVILSIMLCISLFGYPYRISILIPLGALGSIGYTYIKQELRRTKNFLIKTLYPKKFLIIIMILIVSFNPQFSFINDHVSIPSDTALEQLYWIRSHYGYNNTDIVILVNKIVKPINGIGWANPYMWLSAIVGDNYYSGTVLDYLQDLPRKTYYNRTVERYYRGYIKPALKDNIKILIPSQWYCISEIEEVSTREITPGIYELIERNITKIMLMAEKFVKFKIKNIYEYTFPIAGWGNYNFTISAGNPGVDIKFDAINPNEWFGIEIEIGDFIGSVINITQLVIQIETNMDEKDIVLLTIDNGKNKQSETVIIHSGKEFISIILNKHVLPIQHITIFIKTIKQTSLFLNIDNIILT